MSPIFFHDPTPPPPREPPPQRAKVLAFIRCEIASGRPFPSQTAIARHMGWKKNGSAYHCLESLRLLDGQLRLKDGSRRLRQWELAA